MYETMGVNNMIPIPFFKFFAHPPLPFKKTLGNCQVEESNSIPIPHPCKVFPLNVTKLELVDCNFLASFRHIFSLLTTRIFMSKYVFPYTHRINLLQSTFSPSKVVVT